MTSEYWSRLKYGIAVGKPPWPWCGPDKALPQVERKTGLALASGQADAVWVVFSSKGSVIIGGPDIGKTTIVNAIQRILSAKGSGYCCTWQPGAPRNR